MLSTIFEIFLYIPAIVFVFWLTSKPKKEAYTTVREDGKLNSRGEHGRARGGGKSLGPHSSLPIPQFLDDLEKAAKERSSSKTLENSFSGVDYTRLRTLLISGKWREADEETATIMLKVAEREKEGWLDIPDIENFPCSDLRTIDQLWVKCSNGRFGFSTQKCIWQIIEGTPKANWKTWCRFGDLVGWYVKGSWLWWNDVNFSLSAPVGHLPRGGAFIGWGLGDFWRGCRILSSLASRLETSNNSMLEQEASAQLIKGEVEVEEVENEPVVSTGADYALCDESIAFNEREAMSDPLKTELPLSAHDATPSSNTVEQSNCSSGGFGEGAAYAAGGALAGAGVATTVGGMGLAVGGTAVGIGAASVVAAGTVVGSAAYGAKKAIEEGDATALGAAAVGAAAGAGVSAVIGGMGLAVGGTAIAIGMAPVAAAGGVIGLAAYGLGRLLGDSE